MRKLYRLYRKSQETQLIWIKKHPVKWITINVILFAVFYVYIQWADRRDMRKWQADHKTPETA